MMSEPLHVPDHMAERVSWLDANLNRYHPVVVAALIHYNLVRIHPFDNGNGRGTRILKNLIVMKTGFFPLALRTEKKRV